VESSPKCFQGKKTSACSENLRDYFDAIKKKRGARGDIRQNASLLQVVPGGAKGRELNVKKKKESQKNHVSAWKKWKRIHPADKRREEERGI